MYFDFRTHHELSLSTIANVIPVVIQFRKLTVTTMFSSSQAAIAFVGLPIVVPIPPWVAASGMPTIRALLKGSPFNLFSSGVMVAINMEVVAVLDRSIEATMVVS